MISVKDLHKTYRSGDVAVHALRGVTLNIEAGEFLAIAGPSGSGKSTLLNILGCLDVPDSGSVIINSKDMVSLDNDSRADYRRENLGFVFQSFNLIPVLTALENVGFSLNLLGLPDHEVEQKSMDILAEVGLQGMEDRRPGKLSGGQQQRVAIARALVKKPAIILADEPTANLDSKTGKAILNLMEELNRTHGTTFLFSTHDPMVMEQSHRLLNLHDGRIVSDRNRETV